MPLEVALLHLADPARADPVALVLGVEQIAIEIEAEARRRAEAGRPRRDRAVVADLQHPAAPLHEALAVADPREIQRDEHLSLGREHGTERVLVVVPRQRPRRDGLVAIGLSIAIRVAQASELAPLRRVQRAIAIREAERLVQSLGKSGVVRLAAV